MLGSKYNREEKYAKMGAAFKGYVNVHVFQNWMKIHAQTDKKQMN
jgi:hypothetical protein